MNKQEIVKKYLGRQFGHSASGCFLLVKTFYNDEFGIPLKNDYLAILNEFHVPSVPKLGDVVIIKTHPIITNHVGIYLGDGEFMHGAMFPDDRNEVVIHRVDTFPYEKLVAGYLRHPSTI